LNSKDENLVETVLVLQGGGSLGAYECGVYKALYDKGLKFDILAGSSIGAINASIICAAQNQGENVSKILTNFWTELSEENVAGMLPFSSPLISADKMMAIFSSVYSVAFGNNKAFVPRWWIPNFTNYFPYEWNFLYDITPLKKTLKRYIDFDGLRKRKSDDPSSRLIITATDVQKGLPVIFDNDEMDIDENKIVSCAGYPFYGINWTESNGRYLWDGSLLSNTPMLQVIHASPKYDKKYYIVDVFPRQQKELPKNMLEVWHRARDIIFMDKTDRSIEILKEIEKYLSLLKRMEAIINAKDMEVGDQIRDKFKELRPEYQELAQRRGAVIKEVVRIGRRENMHFLFEDADFSKYRINKLISEGEHDAQGVIERLKTKELYEQH
jgi:NTE family protein